MDSVLMCFDILLKKFMMVFVFLIICIMFEIGLDLSF